MISPFKLPLVDFGNNLRIANLESMQDILLPTKKLKLAGWQKVFGALLFPFGGHSGCWTEGIAFGFLSQQMGEPSQCSGLVGHSFARASVGPRAAGPAFFLIYFFEGDQEKPKEKSMERLNLSWKETQELAAQVLEA